MFRRSLYILGFSARACPECPYMPYRKYLATTAIREAISETRPTMIFSPALDGEPSGGDQPISSTIVLYGGGEGEWRENNTIVYVLYSRCCCLLIVSHGATAFWRKHLPKKITPHLAKTTKNFFPFTLPFDEKNQT